MAGNDVNIEYTHDRVRKAIDELFIEVVLLSSDIKRHVSMSSGGGNDKFNKFFPSFNALFLLTRWDKRLRNTKRDPTKDDSTKDDSIKNDSIKEDVLLVDCIDTWINSVLYNKNNKNMVGVELFEEYAKALNDTGIISR